MSASLTVKDGGLATTIQDPGRFGYQSLGIPVSGALDNDSLRLANALVGNELSSGALEIRLLGPTLRVDAHAVRVALVGTETTIEILEPESRRVPAGQSVLLRHGTAFRVGSVTDSGCCYLAVAGGFAIQPVFGSQSTYARGSIGGLHGRALRADDLLPLNLDQPPQAAERRITTRIHSAQQPTIRIVLGPQADYFTDEAISTFLSATYTASREADRMGIRFDGPAISHAKGYNIPSDGIVTGAIQVPGTGLPIALLADRQTTGGYPKIGCVVSADLPALGRLAPGTSVRFSAITVEEAETLRRKSARQLQSTIDSMGQVLDDASALESALHRENLISGAQWIVDEPWPLDED